MFRNPHESIPTFTTRVANRPAHQRVYLARVRIWLEDPITGEPTGKTERWLKTRLALCSRIENYRISFPGGDSLDPEGGIFGWWDEDDENAWQGTPGRRPSFTGDNELYYPQGFSPMRKNIQLRLAIKKGCHAPTVSWLMRLLDVKARDIVLADRHDHRNISYAEQVYWWLKDEQNEEEIDQDTVFYLHDLNAKEIDDMERQRAIDSEKLTFHPYPDVIGCNGSRSHESLPGQLEYVNPYDLTFDELQQASCTRELNSTSGLDPHDIQINNVLSSAEREINDVTQTLWEPSRLVRSPETGHLGFEMREVDYEGGQTYFSYVMNSGNGLVYQLFGRWATVLLCKPSDRDRSLMFREHPHIADFTNHVVPLHTTMPYTVLIATFPWAFPGCSLDMKTDERPSMRKVSSKLTPEQLRDTPLSDLHAATWMVEETERYQTDVYMLPRQDERRRSCAIFGCRATGQRTIIEAQALISNIGATENMDWDDIRARAKDDPTWQAGVTDVYEADCNDDSTDYERDIDLDTLVVTDPPKNEDSTYDVSKLTDEDFSLFLRFGSIAKVRHQPYDPSRPGVTQSTFKYLN